MAATTGTGSRSMRSNSSSVSFTTSLILGSVSKLSNSRMSAPTMKLELLAAHQHEALDLAARMRGLLDPLDDLAELLGRAAPERVHALAFAVDHRPGDALEIDGEAPVMQIGKCRRHDHLYSAAICSGGLRQLSVRLRRAQRLPAR